MEKQLTNEQHTQINWMDRSEIVALLEGASIQCYDHETTEMLKEELIMNILDGTIELPEDRKPDPETGWINLNR